MRPQFGKLGKLFGQTKTTSRRIWPTATYKSAGNAMVRGRRGPGAAGTGGAALSAVDAEAVSTGAGADGAA